MLVFLVLPFLRVLRLVRTVRLLRTGRLLSSAVRGSRSARALLGGRLGWLSAVIAITVLGTSQLLYEFSDYQHYGSALHDAALAAVSGEPVAAVLGAYVLERRAESPATSTSGR